MQDPVKVVVDDRTFEVDRLTQERWPDDFPLAETKAGKPTAAAKRAKPVETLEGVVAQTTKTAADLTASGATATGKTADTATQEGAD